MRLALPTRAFPIAAGWPLGAAALGLIAFTFLFLPSTPHEAGPASAAIARPAHPLTFFDDQAFAQALSRAEAADPTPMPGARAVIVPHHWLAGHLILGSLRDLAASGDYRRSSSSALTIQRRRRRRHHQRPPLADPLRPGRARRRGHPTVNQQRRRSE